MKNSSKIQLPNLWTSESKYYFLVFVNYYSPKEKKDSTKTTS